MCQILLHGSVLLSQTIGTIIITVQFFEEILRINNVIMGIFKIPLLNGKLLSRLCWQTDRCRNIPNVGYVGNIIGKHGLQLKEKRLTNVFIHY